MLYLPPEVSEGKEPSRPHTLPRYNFSEGECDDKEGGEEAEVVLSPLPAPVVRGDGVKYATHRVSRSHSVRNQEKIRNHSQTLALRQKKKGPPPPPPKRCSSAISTSNLTESTLVTAGGGMLDVPFLQQRRASDLGVSVEMVVVEKSSVGSVRSIAAMLEMSSIGGGPKGMALQRNFLQVGGALCLKVPVRVSLK